jgi:hypothetical protein
MAEGMAVATGIDLTECDTVTPAIRDALLHGLVIPRLGARLPGLHDICQQIQSVQPTIDMTEWGWEEVELDLLRQWLEHACAHMHPRDLYALLAPVVQLARLSGHEAVQAVQADLERLQALPRSLEEAGYVRQRADEEYVLTQRGIDTIADL